MIRLGTVDHLQGILLFLGSRSLMQQVSIEFHDVVNEYSLDVTR